MQYEGQNGAWGTVYVHYMLWLCFAVALKQGCQTQILYTGGGRGGGGGEDTKLGQKLLKNKNNVFKDAYKMFNVVSTKLNRN